MAYEYKVKLCVNNPKISNTMEHHVYNFKLPEDGTFIFDAKDGVINTTFTRVDNLYATIVLNFREMQQSFTTKMAEHTFITRNYVKIIGNVLKSYSYWWVIKREILGEGYSTDSIYDEQFSMKLYLKLDILKTVLELPNPYMNRNADVVVRAMHTERFKKVEGEDKYLFDYNQRNNNHNIWSSLVQQKKPLVVSASIQPTQSWDGVAKNAFNTPINGLFWYALIGDEPILTLKVPDYTTSATESDGAFCPDTPFMGYALPLVVNTANDYGNMPFSVQTTVSAGSGGAGDWTPTLWANITYLSMLSQKGPLASGWNGHGMWGDTTFFGALKGENSYTANYKDDNCANSPSAFRSFQKANAQSGATIVGVPIPFLFPRQACSIAVVGDAAGAGYSIDKKNTWIEDWYNPDGTQIPNSPMKSDMVPIVLSGEIEKPTWWAWGIILGINSTNPDQSHSITWKNPFQMPIFKKSDIIQSIRSDREPQLLLPPFREVNLVFSGKPPINLTMLSFISPATRAEEKVYDMSSLELSIYQMLTPKQVTYQTVFEYNTPDGQKQPYGEYRHFGTDYGKIISITDFPQMDVTSDAYLTLMQQHRNAITTSQSVAESTTKLSKKWADTNQDVSAVGAFANAGVSIAKGAAMGAIIGSAGGPIGAGAGAVIGVVAGGIEGIMGVVKAGAHDEQQQQQLNLSLKNQMATIKAPLKDAMDQPESTTYSLGGESFFENLFKHNIIKKGIIDADKPVEAKQIFQIQVRKLMYVEQREVWLQYKKYGSPCHYVRTFANPKDFKTRQNFNYWKIEDAWKMYDPKILSKQAREELNKIFAEGVTMWHNKDMILNYAMPNPELSIVNDTL